MKQRRRPRLERKIHPHHHHHSFPPPRSLRSTLGPRTRTDTSWYRFPSSNPSNRPPSVSTAAAVSAHSNSYLCGTPSSSLAVTDLRCAYTRCPRVRIWVRSTRSPLRLILRVRLRILNGKSKYIEGKLRMMLSISNNLLLHKEQQRHQHPR